MTNVTIFDRPYPADKQAEGMAVQWAVVSGACDKCQYLKRCESDAAFVFPAMAACMVRKNEILQEMEAAHE